MKYKIILLLTILLAIIGCGDTPIFTEMKTNRLKIIIKGTLESEKEDPANSSIKYIAPSAYSINDQAAAAAMEDDSVVNVPKAHAASIANDKSPTTFMLDIAEIRLNGLKISNYRQVYSIPLSDSHPFFNGEGIELVTDDPGVGNYDSVQLYIRKMAFDNAKVYQLVGNSFSFEKNAEMIFNEETVNGFDINQLMVNSYWDSLRTESSSIIRVFPVQIPIIGGMTYTKDNGETVLEIRLVVKNFIKKYEYDFYSAGVYKVCHYYAFSDWLRDVKKGESDIGRNLHAVARAYVPGKTGTITLNSLTPARFIVAIPSTETLTDYGATTTGKLLRTAVGNSDLPLPPSFPGLYIEPILDYYLKYEKYKSDWNTQVTSSSLTLEDYILAWNTYEKDVKGDTTGVNNFGLKIPPYVAYSAGTSASFEKMAPGSYKFYYLDYNPTLPANYGKLFLNTDFQPLFGGADKIINQGTN